MILIDTSVWIDYFRPSPGLAGLELRRMIQNAQPFALTGIVVAEILQGLTRDIPQVEQFLFQWELIEPHGFSTYRGAADLSRLARSRGISLKTIDTLIAAIAIENGAALFTLDKDFSDIACVSPLSLYSLHNSAQ